MENNTEVVARKSAADIAARIRELDAKIASLDERIEKNRADLERNNASLTAKLAELKKAAGQKSPSSKP